MGKIIACGKMPKLVENEYLYLTVHYYRPWQIMLKFLPIFSFLLLSYTLTIIQPIFVSFLNMPTEKHISLQEKSA